MFQSLIGSVIYWDHRQRDRRIARRSVSIPNRERDLLRLGVPRVACFAKDRQFQSLIGSVIYWDRDKYAPLLQVLLFQSLIGSVIYWDAGKISECRKHQARFQSLIGSVIYWDLVVWFWKRGINNVSIPNRERDLLRRVHAMVTVWRIPVSIPNRERDLLRPFIPKCSAMWL